MSHPQSWTRLSLVRRGIILWSTAGCVARPVCDVRYVGVRVNSCLIHFALHCNDNNTIPSALAMALSGDHTIRTLTHQDLSHTNTARTLHLMATLRRVCLRAAQDILSTPTPLLLLHTLIPLKSSTIPAQRRWLQRTGTQESCGLRGISDPRDLEPCSSSMLYSQIAQPRARTRTIDIGIQHVQLSPIPRCPIYSLAIICERFAVPLVVTAISLDLLMPVLRNRGTAGRTSTRTLIHPTSTLIPTAHTRLWLRTTSRRHTSRPAERLHAPQNPCTDSDLLHKTSFLPSTPYSQLPLRPGSQVLRAHHRRRRRPVQQLVPAQT
ncbi:hypothetical protein K466DRAFT_385123 [Polyporus arcularius HHB13444]|uniref:Uncharacterized protein n=1 Tax=Polyporus arcularius HHB13444 TaxID=1314778 RepID=A0A5C3NUV5_9APHY|nr:hypothetical protein K466DRAFT_385123 [Polyporus arcularius HHB13444]